MTCPDWASDTARVIWERLAPGLIARRVLTVWDSDAFLVLCEALARYRAATQLVNGSALLVQGGAGLMKNPALQVQADAERTFLQFAARFGLTPSDRQAIKVEVGHVHHGQGPDRLLS
nr:phage terminase small subunit P27 family [Actinokineospora terrae]